MAPAEVPKLSVYPMPFPQYPKPYDQEVIITPRQHFLAEQSEYQDFRVPSSIILCFESVLMDHYRLQDFTQSRRFWTGEMIYLGDEDRPVALVGNFGIGGPAAAHLLEILIAAGVGHFVVVGHAGGLQKDRAVGSLVLCDQAVRDEGVSHHYLAPEKYAHPSESLTHRLQVQLDATGMAYTLGTSWTISSMYRETKEEVRHYAEEGVAMVEMELASLFAVATFREVHLAALLVISDYVAFEEWDEHLHAQSTSEALFAAMEVAQKALLKST